MSANPPAKHKRPPKSNIKYFRDTPEWRNQVRAVLSLKRRGFAESDICAVSSIPHETVKRIVEEEEENKTIIKEVWDENKSIMREILGMGIHGIKECLKEMIDPVMRSKMIRNMDDLGKLTKIVSEVNMLLRLEEGKSTQNIATTAHTYNETRVVLQQLQKLQKDDPVFNYGNLPESIEPPKETEQ